MLQISDDSYLKYRVIESSHRVCVVELQVTSAEAFSQLLVQLDDVVPADHFATLTLPCDRSALIHCAEEHGYAVQVRALPLFADEGGGAAVSDACILVKQRNPLAIEKQHQIRQLIDDAEVSEVPHTLARERRAILEQRFQSLKFVIVDASNCNEEHIGHLMHVLLEKLGSPPAWHDRAEITPEFLRAAVARGASFVYAVENDGDNADYDDDDDDVIGCAGLVPLSGSVYDVCVLGAQTATDNCFEVSHVVVLGKRAGKYSGLAPLMQHILIRARSAGPQRPPRLIILDATYDRNKPTGGGAWKMSTLGEWTFAGICFCFTGIMVRTADSYAQNNHLCVYYMSSTAQQWYGFHRVLDERPCTVQSALRVSPKLPCAPTEMLLRVELLNIDSTSTRNIVARGGVFQEHVLAIVAQRGKMHNPETQSGGVLVGVIEYIGSLCSNVQGLAVGDRVVPLCSMSAIPMALEELGPVDGEQVQVIRGHAIVFESMKLAVVPEDLPLATTLHAIDVSRLVPQLQTIVCRYTPETALLVGCGASALVAMVRLLELSDTLQVTACDISESNLRVGRRVVEDNPRVHFRRCDATNSLELLQLGLFDIVLSLVNVAGVEAGCSMVATKAVCYFSMATSFASACLSTDLTGKPIDVLIGAGVFEEQAVETLALLRKYPALLDAFS